MCVRFDAGSLKKNRGKEREGGETHTHVQDRLFHTLTQGHQCNERSPAII